jgi:hypothetical protein
VIQMACTHAATMSVLARLGGGHGRDQNLAAKAAAVSRLARTFAIQAETLRRLRNGGSQLVRVEHVHVHAGGQAVVGVVEKGGDRRKSEDQTGAKQIAHAEGADNEREPVPVTGDAKRSLPRGEPSDRPRQRERCLALPAVGEQRQLVVSGLVGL